jgi:hypothetical protein
VLNGVLKPHLYTHSLLLMASTPIGGVKAAWVSEEHVASDAKAALATKIGNPLA